MPFAMPGWTQLTVEVRAHPVKANSREQAKTTQDRD